MRGFQLLDRAGQLGSSKARSLTVDDLALEALFKFPPLRQRRLLALAGIRQ